jgi:hypothetical protein
MLDRLKFWQMRKVEEMPLLQINPLNNISASISDFCYGSCFSLNPDWPIQTQRYIELDNQRWRSIEMETRPNTQHQTGYLEPVTKHTVLAKNMSFGNALQQLHEFEVGSKLVGDIVTSSAHDRFAPEMYYKEVAFREGLIFDTQHRLHTSKDGRPLMLHEDATFLNADLQKLVQWHYRAPVEDMQVLIGSQEPLDLIQKSAVMRVKNYELKKAISDVRWLYSNRMDPRDRTLKLRRLLQDVVTENSEANEKEELNTAADYIYLMSHAIYVSNEGMKYGADNHSADGLYYQAQSVTELSHFIDISKQHYDVLENDHLKKFLFRIASDMDYAVEVKKHMRNMFEVWEDRISVEGKPAPFQKTSKLARNDFDLNAREIMGQIDKSLGVAVNQINHMDKQARFSNNVAHYIIDKEQSKNGYDL